METLAYRTRGATVAEIAKGVSERIGPTGADSPLVRWKQTCTAAALHGALARRYRRARTLFLCLVATASPSRCAGWTCFDRVESSSLVCGRACGHACRI